MTLFTVRNGRRYRATIALNWAERLAGNERIARYLREAGFTEVNVSGKGGSRHATALWQHNDRTGEIPPQIVEMEELEA